MAGRHDPEWLAHLEAFGLRSLVKLVLAVIVLLLFLVFVSILPGVDRLVPGLPITFATLVNGLVTLVLVLLLLQIASEVKAVIQRLQLGVPDIAPKSAAVVYWTIVFLAIVIAYEGFGAAIAPVVTETGILWAFDLAFFLLGAVPLLLIGYHLFRLLDPLAELFVGKLRSESAGDPATIQTTLPIETATAERDDIPDRS